ncbi:MAG TPA: PIN domain nuclease, partial [Oscillospiraceae bacterium]|nr:PIN domain nuclease [Oscillospiraceae bacterium]
MINRIIRGILIVFGAVSGAALYAYIVDEMYIIDVAGNFSSYVIGIIISSLISGVALFILSPWLINQGKEIANRIEKELSKVPTVDIVLGSAGLIV